MYYRYHTNISLIHHISGILHNSDIWLDIDGVLMDYDGHYSCIFYAISHLIQINKGKVNVFIITGRSEPNINKDFLIKKLNTLHANIYCGLYSRQSNYLCSMNHLITRKLEIMYSYYSNKSAKKLIFIDDYVNFDFPMHISLIKDINVNKKLIVKADIVKDKNKILAITN